MSIGVSVGVGSIGVGKGGVVVGSIAIVTSIESRVVQPGVSLGVSLSISLEKFRYPDNVKVNDWRNYA